MKLHHTGYVTGNIEETAKVFADLGYVAQPMFDDTVQKCFICFLKKGSEETLVELVQPVRMLKKIGVSPYHLCYEVDDVQAIYEELSKKDNWVAMFEPVKAVAFDI